MLCCLFWSVLVTKTCNLKHTVRKLVDAKFQNAGQFCVSPGVVQVNYIIIYFAIFMHYGYDSPFEIRSR